MAAPTRYTLEWDLKQPRSSHPVRKRKSYISATDLSEDSTGGVTQLSEVPSWPIKKIRNMPSKQVKTSNRLTGVSRLEDAYILLETLGSGHFGSVQRCVSRATGEAFACKSIEKLRLTSEKEVQEVRREIAVMEALSQHPNVVSLKSVFEDVSHVHIVMELCEGGELFDEIVARKQYEECDASEVFRGIVDVVSFCHSKGVMHRDLKPENLLLATKFQKGKPHPAVKLADYGLALFLNKENGAFGEGLAGSPFYMAPEVVKGFQYGFMADIWSLGVILYILLCGVPPFWGQTEEETFEAINRGELEFSENVWAHISKPAQQLVSWMLQKDPSKRPTAEQVLGHPWLSEAITLEREEECVLLGPVSTSSFLSEVSPVLEEVLLTERIQQAECAGSFKAASGKRWSRVDHLKEHGSIYSVQYCSPVSVLSPWKLAEGSCEVKQKMEIFLRSSSNVSERIDICN